MGRATYLVPEVIYCVGVAGGGGLLVPAAGLLQLRWVDLGGEQEAEVVHGVGVAGGGGLAPPPAAEATMIRPMMIRSHQRAFLNQGRTALACFFASLYETCGGRLVSSCATADAPLQRRRLERLPATE